MAPEDSRTMQTTARAKGVKAVPGAPLERLRARIGGDVLLPGDAGFEEATRIWNGMIAKTPALVVQPTSAGDAAEAVAFARQNGLMLSVKGGGHNIAGTALVDGGLTIDMSRMRDVRVDADARTVRVGAGCLLADVDRETQKHGLATVLGFVSDTGVAGLTLGGGFGYLTRRFGWAVDNLLEVEIVTADGEVRRASRDEHADLFWAIRGGGGNFGVVTEFTFRLHEVGPMVMGGVMAWPAETPEAAHAAIAAYRAFTESAPREVTVFCVLRRAPPAPFIPEDWHGRRVALFLVCHSGPLARAIDDLAPLKAALGEPVVNVVAPRPYVEQQSLIDGSEPHGMHYYWKTENLASISDGLVRVVRDLSLENPLPMAEIGFIHLSGALNERASDDGAVGNRDTRYMLGLTGMWAPDDPHGDEHRAWVRSAWERFRPHSTGRNYVNFQTEDEDSSRTRDTYGPNYDRLVAVKRKYDPDNLFRSNRNVPPAA